MAEDPKNKGFSTERVVRVYLNMRRLFGDMLAESPLMVLSTALVMVALAILPLLEAGIFGELLNEIGRLAGSREADKSRLWSCLVLFLCASALTPYLVNLRSFKDRKFWFLLTKRYDLEIIRAKGALDIASHEDSVVQDLFSRVQENGPWRSANFFNRAFYLLQTLLSLIFASWVLLYLESWVLIPILVGTIPVLMVEMWYGEELWGIFHARAQTRRRFWAVQSYFANPSGLAEVKLAQNDRHFLAILRKIFQKFQDEELRGEKRKLVWQALSVTFSQILFSYVIICLIEKVVAGNTEIGTLTFMIASISTFRTSLSSMFSALGNQYQDSLFVTEVFELLDLRPRLVWKSPGASLHRNGTPAIVFENVSACYPGSDRKVLHDFSLEIKPGERVAIVGENGAGKSTFVKLLLRFYDPVAGCIRIGGHDLRDLEEQGLYEMFAVLPQQYSTYHFTVGEVIGLGRSSRELDQALVEAAANVSEARSFIERLPDGYGQQIGKQFSGGVELSGGEYQRLALARVLYRQGSVLVLDEPTSASDARAEERFFDKLLSSLDGQTLILISHRFSTVRKADRIVVIADGAVKEQGTHAELMALNGIYHDLFTHQQRGYL